MDRIRDGASQGRGRVYPCRNGGSGEHGGLVVKWDGESRNQAGQCGASMHVLFKDFRTQLCSIQDRVETTPE